MDIGETAYMLDAYHKNPMKGKIVTLLDHGCTVENERGIRLFGGYDRCYQVGYDLFEAARNDDGSKFK